jgi:hypothetical protein
LGREKEGVGGEIFFAGKSNYGQPIIRNKNYFQK